eukprot:752432-Karenia_brevis.AAC.1
MSPPFPPPNDDLPLLGLSGWATCRTWTTWVEMDVRTRMDEDKDMSMNLDMDTQSCRGSGGVVVVLLVVVELVVL